MFNHLILVIAPVICSLYWSLSIIYALYLHPLRHIPGPGSWIILPLLRHISGIRGRLDTDIHRLHETYGPVVRFSDNEVSFITAEAWSKIYGHGHRELPKVSSSAANPRDIVSSNEADHSRFRKALSPAFSAKGLQAQEPLINSYVDTLISRLKGIAESQLPADMVKWYNLTTFDIIGDLAFGESFGGLESSQYHYWVATIFQFIKFIPFVRLRDAYPMFFKALSLVMPKKLLTARERQRAHTRITVQKRLDNASKYNRGDFMDSMLRNHGEKDGLSHEELVANANILILAGSETTATLLSGITYWLLKSPDALAKLTTEVRSTMKSEADITASSVVAKLPYMQACIDEAFRMYPPVPTGLQRMTIEPTLISGYELPPGTKVFVHSLAAYQSSSNFHAPKRYLPERWLPEARTDPASPFFSDNRDVLQPFSTGPRNCIGRNLALVEMRIIVARLLWNFDLELCEESRHWSEQKTFAVWEKSPLMCKLSLRT
ncbi:hypothetical protein AbraIFM66950_010930 [Aspergillus brasiliensis]|nr:hypothetical protein AbraIFM66950_010930 [Aspergillus brasiliensis]